MVRLERGAELFLLEVAGFELVDEIDEADLLGRIASAVVDAPVVEIIKTGRPTIEDSRHAHEPAGNIGAERTLVIGCQSLSRGRPRFFPLAVREDERLALALDCGRRVARGIDELLAQGGLIAELRQLC